MLIPDRDLDTDYDDPDVVLPWWAILSAAAWALLALLLLLPVMPFVLLTSRPKRHDPLFVDPLEAVRVLDGDPSGGSCWLARKRRA